MTEPDELAIEQVVVDGHKLKLTKAERVIAIRLMTERGIEAKVMAERLKVRVETIRRDAKDANIELPKAVEPVHWTYNYVFARGAEREQRKRDAAKQRAANHRERKRRESAR